MKVSRITAVVAAAFLVAAGMAVTAQAQDKAKAKTVKTQGG